MNCKMTPEQALRVAEEEGLTLHLSARGKTPSATGFKGVGLHKRRSNENKKFVVTHWNPMTQRSSELGVYDTAEEAALNYARHDRDVRHIMEAEEETASPTEEQTMLLTPWLRTKAWAKNTEVRLDNILRHWPDGSDARASRALGRSRGMCRAAAGSSTRPPLAAAPESCSICLDALDSEWGTTPCGHDFHVECLRDWRLVRGGTACPVCRHPLAASRRMFETSGGEGTARSKRRAGAHAARDAARGEKRREATCPRCLSVARGDGPNRHVAHTCAKKRPRIGYKWALPSR